MFKVGSNWEGELNSQELSELRASVDDSNRFIACVDRLSRLYPKRFPCKGIIHGRAQQELYAFLLERCSILSQGRFVGQRGTSSSTLVGCKDVGKTIALQTFVSIASILFENVVPVFITYKDMVTTGAAVKYSFIEVIRQALGERCNLNVRPRRLFEIGITPVAECLEENNKYLLLIIDGLDMLYRTDPKDHPKITTSISELSGIGNSPSGRVACILSGSSSMLEHLIFTDILPGMQEEFPGLRGAINLNYQKFAPHRISSSSPLDEDAVRSITLTLGTQRPTADWIRLMTFLAGANPREMQGVLQMRQLDDIVSNSNGQHTLTIEPISRFWASVQDQLLENNKDIVVDLFTDVARIAATNWTNEFKPLDFEDCKMIWATENKDTSSLYDAFYAVFHLADRGWLTTFGIENGHPRQVYPGTMLKLMRHYMNSQHFPEATKQTFWQNLWALYSRLANNATTQAAVVNSVDKIAEKTSGNVAEKADVIFGARSRKTEAKSPDAPVAPLTSKL